MRCWLAEMRSDYQGAVGALLAAGGSLAIRPRSTGIEREWKALSRRDWRSLRCITSGDDTLRWRVFPAQGGPRRCRRNATPARSTGLICRLAGQLPGRFKLWRHRGLTHQKRIA